jgi:hypothetical protein
MFPIFLLVMALGVGIATGFAINRAIRGEGFLDHAAGFGGVIFGLYALLILGNIYTLYQLFDYFRIQVIGTGWIGSPYLVRAIVGVLAFGGYALIPTLTVSFLTFRNRRFALWAAGGYVGICLLLYLLAPHDRMVCRDPSTGEFLCTYEVDPHTKQIVLYPKDIKFDQFGQPLKPVDEQVLAEYREQRESPPPTPPVIPTPAPIAAPQAPSSPAVPGVNRQAVPPPIADVSQPQGERSGTLHYQGPPVAYRGTVVFDNLPKKRLKFGFDSSSWSLSIKPNADGTKKVTLTSLEQGYQTNCDVHWEIIE